MPAKQSVALHDFLRQPWDIARRVLVEDLEGLHESVRSLQNEVFDGVEGEEAVQLHSTAGTAENNFRLAEGAGQLTVETTTANFTGFEAGESGKQILLVYTGTGTCKIHHQSTSSIINNRVTCPSTNGLIVGKNGLIQLTYDDDLQSWRAFTINPGNPITPTFAAGNFTGNGAQTWTVGSGDVTTYAYSLHNKLLTVFLFLVTTTVGGTPNPVLLVAIPAGYVVTKSMLNPVVIDDNSVRVIGYAYTMAASTTIQISKIDISNFAAATNTTQVFGQITFEVN